MAGRTAPPVLPTFIPAAAVEQWQALTAALADTATPCSTDPNAWFDTADTGPAVEACGHCPVLAQCGQYADAAHERHGVWAGRVRSTRCGRSDQGGVES